MSKRTLAILAAIGATVIYGINHTVAKGVMPMHVKPFGFIFLRVGGATLLFWLISLFVCASSNSFKYNPFSSEYHPILHPKEKYI